MKKEITDALLREFLLGNIDDAGRDEIERLFLTDPETKERVLIIQHDLIEDYLENNLANGDKQKFLLRFAQTPAQRRELRITKSLKELAGRDAAKQNVSRRPSVWANLGSRLRVKPLFLVPIALMIILAVALMFVWRNRERQLRRHMEVESELARLNASTGQYDQSSETASLILSPVTVRGEEPQIEFKPSNNIRILELSLPWIQKERYSTYQVQLRQIADDESFLIRNLQTADASAIRLRLPARILKAGQYQVQITGIASDGTVSPPEDYTFTVTP